MTHASLANAVRFLAADAVEKAQSGHPGLPLGMADVATVLFSKFLRFDPSCPHWPNRDRFVLSAGHGSALLYALAYLVGYPRMTLDELKRFRQLGSLTPGHPEHDLDLGIETTTGPLGQGLANAVGMALGERALNAQFGSDLIDHHTYVIASDGDMMEGISHEAASLAGHLRLNKLIVLYDDNSVSIDGPTSLSFSDNTVQRFESYGWITQRVDGHDAEAITYALKIAQKNDRPTLIACKTIIGYGAPTKAGKAAVHGSPLGAEELAATRKALNWDYPAFSVPEQTLGRWRSLGMQHQETRLAWEKSLENHPQQAEFKRRLRAEIPAAVPEILIAYKKEMSEKRPNLATRQTSGAVLEVLAPHLPEMIGGSADLTPSNNTRTKMAQAIEPASSYKGQYLHWGVREHGMAAAMNGLALYGGFIPFGGTFLTFSDYCRPALRLAALMGCRVIHVMTHDSIGLGEDGPTHQPVEHLAALRTIPNLLVFRPADAIETAECWALALEHQGPSVLALSRQTLPTVRTGHMDANLSAKGAYVLTESSGSSRMVTLLATGSEVSIALEARAILEQQGISTAVISVPCFELLSQCSEAEQRQILRPHDGSIFIGIEAGLRFGWDRWIGAKGGFVGMKDFGASAPATQLYQHFGITAEEIVACADMLLNV